MGLGKVFGWGIAFVFLLGVTITGFADVVTTITQSSVPITIPFLVGAVGATVIWAIITYFVGRRFIRAIKQYRASRTGKPLQ
jgi:uncharacterized protein (DUF2062 family)